MQKYIHLLTGKPGETEIAVFCPTTLYRLGASLEPTIQACYGLRDLCDFDVLDELLIADGALTTQRYKALVVFQAEIVDQPVLKKLEGYLRAGGRIIMPGQGPVLDVEGKHWPRASELARVAPVAKDAAWLKELSGQLAGYRGVDGKIDGLWTCRRGDQLFVYNSSSRPVEVQLGGQPVQVPAHTISESSPPRLGPAEGR
jgi:hypothetical protein